MTRNSADDSINEAFETGYDEHSETVDISGEVIEPEVDQMDERVDLEEGVPMQYDLGDETHSSTDVLAFEVDEGLGVFGQLEEVFQEYGFRNEDAREASQERFMEVYSHPEASGEIFVYDEDEKVRAQYEEDGELKAAAVLNDPLRNGWELEVSGVLNEAVPGVMDVGTEDYPAEEDLVPGRMEEDGRRPKHQK